MFRMLRSKIENNRCLDLNKSTLFYQCIWDKPNAERDIWMNVRESFVKVRIASGLIYGFVIYPGGAITSWGDITGVCEGVINTFIVSMSLVKSSHIIFAPEIFHGLMETLEEMYNNGYNSSKLNEHEKAIRDETQKYTNWAIYYYLLAAFAIVLYSIGLFPILLYFRKLYVGGWYPYPVDMSPYFEVSLILLAISILFLSQVACVDSFLMALMIQTIGQFKLLRYNLKNLHKLSVDKVIAKRNAYVKIDSTYQVTEMVSVSWIKHENRERKRCWNSHLNSPESFSRDGVVERKHNFSECPSVSQQELMIVNEKSPTFQQEVNMEMERRLRYCIQHHQELCSLIGRLDSALRYILVNQLACNIVPIVTIMLWLTLVDSIDERALGIIVLALACQFELLVLCFLGNVITDEGSKLRDGLYSCGWYDASESFKRSMRIMMSRANVPLDIKIGGIAPLSMVTFQEVVNYVYRTYTTLQSMV